MQWASLSDRYCAGHVLVDRPWPDGFQASHLRAVEPYPKAYLYERIVAAKLFIDAHFSESIEVDDISEEAHFSKFHFIRVFREMFGRTPHEHLMHRRIEHAKALVGQGMKAVDACYAVGFTSTSSFTRLFKRHTGSTPAVFREQALNRRTGMNAEPLKFIPDCFSTAHRNLRNSNSGQGEPLRPSLLCRTNERS